MFVDLVLQSCIFFASDFFCLELEHKIDEK